MLTDEYKYIIGKNTFQFPVSDCSPNSKRVFVMNGITLGVCPTDDMGAANQIARLVSRACHINPQPLTLDKDK